MSVSHGSRRRVEAIVLLTAFLTAGPVVGQQNLSDRGYDKVKSLKEAVDVVKAQLTADGKPEYAALVTEDRVRQAIRTAVQSYDAILAVQGKRPELVKDRWEKDFKPIYMSIADKSHWPANCAFGGFYRLWDERGVAYDGLGLRLKVEKQAEPRLLFALPIMDLYFGKFEAPRP